MSLWVRQEDDRSKKDRCGRTALAASWNFITMQKGSKIPRTGARRDLDEVAPHRLPAGNGTQSGHELSHLHRRHHFI